ncbi:MAG: DUF547 domain-containing protein [Candidatus Melainabacteria bacterium]|jgi:hypothetical protein|nr:DUF547 domain-containing protein [Candidatus Melainabacteria bacterium]MBX9674379.1 DUF547 domain-containing protein [Candidatus Obscuribacterales bacterium]
MKIGPKLILYIVAAGALLLGAASLVMFSLANAPEWLMAINTSVTHPTQPDYQAADKALAALVKNGRVDYQAAKNNADLKQALDQLAHTAPDKFAKPLDVLCYWINAKSLITIKTIADKYPIRNNSAKPLGRDLNGTRYVVGGKAMSAQDIWLTKIKPYLMSPEKALINDPRAIMLVNSGAMGDPPVLDHCVTAKIYSKDLAANTFLYVRDKNNVNETDDGSYMSISPYFQWNSDIIERHFSDAFQFVLYYQDLESKNYSGTMPFYTFNKDFDWRLNDINTTENQ